ncbi:MAG: glutamine-hydrolyzing carbamoyl-phosphate synthase small subunit [Actinobacteria bacterium]|nr:glutamine-hydrolyzing carbamoyl-phosphate synthase small subunit [Actinomycetota bacterium]
MSRAYLLLEDGIRFDGEGAGAITCALGEAVFTTGMTGYQETLTDPSFNGQIITFSAPMIGNYGVEADVGESDRVQAVGMVCREVRNAAPPGRTGLLDWLAAAGVPVLFGIDTRALVQHLRDKGAMRGALVTDGTSPEEAAARIAQSPEMAGRDLAAGVSRPRREQDPGAGAARCTVVLLDYGAKDSIGDLVAQAGAHVVILPHDATADDIRAVDPDGILLANGPGDPGAMDRHVGNVQAMLELGVPVFGICLGHQLLARALGLETYKLRFGHRGANHPVLECETGRVLVTSQNHGFAVKPPEGQGDVTITHTSLYDETVEGLRLQGRPVWSMQFHPEASPGPHDARDALVAFVDAAAAYRAERGRA